MDPMALSSLPRSAGLVAVLVLIVVGSSTTAGATSLVGPGTPTGVGAHGDAGEPSRHVLAAEGSTAATIEVVHELRLTPTRPGEIAVTTRFSLPSDVVSLGTSVPPEATAVTADGFDRQSATDYQWDGRSRTPSLAYRLAVNRTMTTTGPIAGSGDYLYADPGPWALVAVQPVPISWRYRGDRPVDVSRRTTVDGPGAAGDHIAFLGEHREFTRTAHGQTVRLVVPEAADLAEPPGRILDSLLAASDALRVGDRDDQVFIVAAPTRSVQWAVRGFQIGDADAWVRDRERLDTPDNVWIHEYVHTRQDYRADTGARWFTEASAAYYAALFALDQDRIDFDAFSARLAFGTRPPDRDAVLADPTTWDTVAPYTKGVLVAGELDRQLRSATDRRRSLQDVFARTNAHPEPVSGSTLLGFARLDGGDEVGRLAERYATTRDAPTTWDATAHGAAFATVPARISAALLDGPDGLRVSGPYRNATVATGRPVELAAGETLLADIAVSNAGGARGDYDVALLVDGTPVARETGSLAAGESRVLTFAHRFDAIGEYAVVVAGEPVAVGVRSAATPRVVELSVSQSGPRADGRTGIVATASVTNPDSVPAVGGLTLARNGTAVETRRIVLGPGGDTTVEFAEVALEPGVHRLRVGDATATVELATAASEAASTSADPLRVEGDGFGTGAALVALLAFVYLFSRRR